MASTRSTILTLPRPIIDEIHRRLRRGDRNRDIAAWVIDQGHPISPAAMGRYAKAWRSRAASNENLLEVAALARESGVDLLDMLNDMAEAAAVRAAALVERGLTSESEGIDRATWRAFRIARLARNLEAARISGNDRRSKTGATDTRQGRDAEAERRLRDTLGIDMAEVLGRDPDDAGPAPVTPQDPPPAPPDEGKPPAV